MAEIDESVIDLTDCSFTLADHCRLNNVIISLDTDDSFGVVENNQSNNASDTRTRTGRKRRKKTRVTVDPDTSINDLCTPEIKNKRRSSRQTKKSENTTVEDPTGEPKAKKVKQQNICCPICFEEFNGQTLASTSCGHVFCLQCLKLALKRESRCPTCRTTLKGSSKFHPIFL